MDPNTIFNLGTERTAMISLVPFRPVPQGRIELRHALNKHGQPRNAFWKSVLVGYARSTAVKYRTITSGGTRTGGRLVSSADISVLDAVTATTTDHVPGGLVFTPHPLKVWASLEF